MINTIILDDVTGIVLGVVFGVIALIFVIIILSHIKIVKETDEFVIERLGKYVQTWKVGFHFLIPFFERIANKV